MGSGCSYPGKILTCLQYKIIRGRGIIELKNNMNNKVFLIGGAPGVGKTTVGTALAIKLGITSLTIDDLLTAAVAVTTPETHPGLHIMRKVPYFEYYTNSSVNQLKADATLRHEAVWPMVEHIIQKYARRESAIMIDGWHLRPTWVAQLNIKMFGQVGWLHQTHFLKSAKEKIRLFFKVLKTLNGCLKTFSREAFGITI